MSYWPIHRMKHLYRVVDSRAGAARPPLMSVSIHRGVVPRSEMTDDEHRADDLSFYKRCSAGDLVLNRMRAFQGAVGISPIDGLVSPDYIVLRPVDCDGRYLHHLFRSHWFVGEMIARLRGIGSTDTGSVRTPRINADDFGEIAVRVPPRPEQRAIADFLDAEAARIDSLIAKKRRMLELLDERLNTAIRSALEEVSAPLLPLKRRWRVTDCKHRTPSYVKSGYPVVSPGDATPGPLDLRRAHRFVNEADFRDLAAGIRRPRRGDIIYSRNASIGIASYVDTDQPFCMGQDVCLITSTDQNQKYLMHVLNSIGVDQLDEAKIGSTFNRVNVAQILEVRVPCPPPERQRSIAAELDRLARAQETAVATLTHQIDLLVEKRQTLITAAVTGELDIPGVAA